VYTISVPIVIPGLIFDKKDAEKEVYIVGNDGPVLNIVMLSGQTVLFRKIHFMHTGVNINSRFIENAPNEPKYQIKASKKCIGEFYIHPGVDTIIIVHSGDAFF
jgi:hypothetical protein